MRMRLQKRVFNLAGDETSWGQQEWEEPQSGLVRIILNKPGLCKVGKVVLVSGVDRIWLCTYFRQHKFWERQ